MKKIIIAGNWKMQGSLNDVQSWCNTLASQALPKEVDVLFFPPAVFLDITQHLLRTTDVLWGAQNVSAEKEGPFTGEISASMLENFGTSFVLLGHSERRQLYQENNALVARKIKMLSNTPLRPVLCVGETQQEREKGQTQAVLNKQLAVLQQLNTSQLERCIIAYEPVWAIGTGLAATPEQAQSVHAMMRDYLSQITEKKLANTLKILYGGSVNPGNVEALLSMPDVNGVLVGKASLTADTFLSMIRIAGKLFQ